MGLEPNVPRTRHDGDENLLLRVQLLESEVHALKTRLAQLELSQQGEELSALPPSLPPLPSAMAAQSMAQSAAPLVKQSAAQSISVPPLQPDAVDLPTTASPPPLPSWEPPSVAAPLSDTHLSAATMSASAEAIIPEPPVSASSQTVQQPEIPPPPPVFAQPQADQWSEASHSLPASSAPAQKIKRPRTPQQPANQPANPLMQWLMRGNPLLKTGMVVLFLGLAFLLRYVGGHLPLGLKYLGVFGAGVAASVSGWKLQKRQREYGLALQGFGFAVMYLTTLFAFKWHALLIAGGAFVLMVGLVALMTACAVKQDSKILAQVAVVGGLAAPLLASDGSGKYLVLFSYLALLNTGVAAIAWFKAWRSLNLIGFIGTFGIAVAWGTDAYTLQHWATVQPFLLYHWLLYTLIACFFAYHTLRKEPLNGRLAWIPDHASLERIWQTFIAYGSRIGALDSTLLFGTAIAAFTLQYYMVADSGYAYAAAWSAMVFALVYAGFALHFARKKQTFAVMKQAFMALVLVFVTLAVPLALEGQWTAAAWALEAALVYGFGLQQRQPQTRLAALGVYALAAARQFTALEAGVETLLSGSVLGTCLAAACGLGMYYAWYRSRREGSAVWESNAQQTVLLVFLAHALTLPMLLWHNFGVGIALTVYAVVFAILQFRRANLVLSVFVLLCQLITVNCLLEFYATAWVQTQNNGLLLGHALLWVATAYLLHQARWLAEKPSSSASTSDKMLNIVAGWAAVLWGLHAAFGASRALLNNANLYQAYWNYLLILLPVAAWAYRARWRQGLQAVALGVCLWLVLVAKWAIGWATVPYLGSGSYWFPGSLQLLCATAMLAYFMRPFRHTLWQGLSEIAPLLVWTFWLGKLGQAYWAGTVWAQLMWVLAPVVAWWGMTKWRNSRYTAMPTYWHFVSGMVALYALCWLLWVNFTAPQPSGFPYLPLLSPLDLASIAVIWQGLRWLRVQTESEQGEHTAVLQSPILRAALLCLMASMMILRLWHIYAHVAWSVSAWLSSFGLQATLSIVWALLAIGLMVYGNQRKQRDLWLSGASLMAVVVVKLFLIELGDSGGVARIVSFIMVGLLLLLVGWFAPAPPKEADTSKAADQ